MHRYIKSLSFRAEPDYDYLQSLLVEVIEERQEELDFVYDWH